MHPKQGADMMEFCWVPFGSVGSHIRMYSLFAVYTKE